MVEAEVTKRGGGGHGKERDQSLGMIVFDATTNHYDDGKDNAAVGTITATTMMARTTKKTLTTTATTTAMTTPVLMQQPTMTKTARKTTARMMTAG